MPKIARRTWIWFAVAFAAWVIVCVTVLITLPAWGRPWVRDALIEKLSRRLEQPVALSDLELSYERIIIRELVVGDPAARQPIDDEFDAIVARHEPDKRYTKIERFAFYDRAKKAAAVVQTGEARLYGNIILKKGVIRPNA